MRAGSKPGFYMDLIEKIGEIARKDGRYSAEAFMFLLRALDFTAKRVVKRDPPEHVTAGELLEGVRRLGLAEFGYLAPAVFEQWGVKTTRDFGEIVFTLVEEGLMGKTERDSIEDFDAVYDFEEVFQKSFEVDWDQILP